MAPLKANRKGVTLPSKIEVAIPPTVREPQIKATTGKNPMLTPIAWTLGYRRQQGLPVRHRPIRPSWFLR